MYFQTYASERSVNPHALVRGELYLQRLTLFAENDLLNTRQRPNYEIDARARRLENTIRLGGELRLSPKFSVELAGRQSLVKFDGDASFSGSYLEQSSQPRFARRERQRSLPLDAVDDIRRAHRMYPRSVSSTRHFGTPIRFASSQASSSRRRL